MASSMGPVRMSPSVPPSRMLSFTFSDLLRSSGSLEVVDMRLEEVEIPTAEADTVLDVGRLTFAIDAGDLLSLGVKVDL